MVVAAMPHSLVGMHRVEPYSQPLLQYDEQALVLSRVTEAQDENRILLQRRTNGHHHQLLSEPSIATSQDVCLHEAEQEPDTLDMGCSTTE